MNKYQFENELGTGSFGIVYLVTHKKTKKQYVLKMINITESPYLKSIIKNESTILQKLSSDHNKYIVKYYKSFTTVHKNKKYICIIMEYIKGITLYDYITYYIETKKSIRPSILIRIIYNLIAGLKYIHSLNYAHRDIKLENIMITSNGNIKYIDFGLACFKYKIVQGDTCKKIVGTITYLAPEVASVLFNKNLKYKKYKNIYSENIIHAKTSDVWSLSIVIYLLCNKKTQLFDNVTNDIQSSYILNDSLTSSQLSILQSIIINKINPSNYRLNTTINKFVNFIIVKNWKIRPTINQLYTIFLDFF